MLSQVPNLEGIDDDGLRANLASAKRVWRASEIEHESGLKTFGVYAAQAIEKGELVEKAYCLPVKQEHLKEASAVLRTWLFPRAGATSSDGPDHVVGCELSRPMISEKVQRKDGQAFRSPTGWECLALETLIVVDVDKDGNFRLKNGRGQQSDFLVAMEYRYEEVQLFPLGWGFLYNQTTSAQATLTWEHEVSQDLAGSALHWVNFRAERDIEAGEELTIAFRPSSNEQNDGQRRDCLASLLHALQTAGKFEVEPAKWGIDTSAGLVGGLPATWGTGALWHVEPAEVRCSKIQGNGVFATRKINKGEVVEVHPFLYVSKEDLQLVLKHYRYVAFDYDHYQKTGLCKVSLGYGSIYNHAEDHNLQTKTAHGPVRVHTYLQASRDVEEGEELTISYGANYWKTREGHALPYGKKTYWNEKRSDCYLGSWKGDVYHGWGRYIWQTGEYYEGVYVDGKKHGPGLYWNVDGTTRWETYHEGKRKGVGVLWSADRSEAWRLLDGAKQGEIDDLNAEILAGMATPGLYDVAKVERWREKCKSERGK